jgi:hypothetical protein
MIGDKNNFAVEYSFEGEYSEGMGYGRIWIGKEFFGTNKDLIYLGGYLLKTLHEIKDAKELNEDLKHLPKDKLFDLFYSGDYYDSDKYLVRGSTFTDDFSIWCYRIGNVTYILWKIIRTDFFDDLNDYKKDIFLKDVSTDTLNDIVSRLESEFRDKGILKVK